MRYVREFNSMTTIILFITIGSIVFIGAYYLLVRRYYWGPKSVSEKTDKPGKPR